jgi:hypothetical protein
MRELRSGFAIAQRQALTKEAKAERLAPQLTQERFRRYESGPSSQNGCEMFNNLVTSQSPTLATNGLMMVTAVVFVAASAQPAQRTVRYPKRGTVDLSPTVSNDAMAGPTVPRDTNLDAQAPVQSLGSVMLPAEADMAKKDQPLQKVTAPFSWVFEG